MNPASVQFSPGAYLAPVVDWLHANLHPLFAAISTLIEAVLGGIEKALLFPPPYLLVAIVVVLALMLANVRVAILAAFALGFCLLANLWTASMQTIALVSVAVLISVLIAFPLG